MLAMMRTGIVNEEQNLPPTFADLVEETNKVLLLLGLRERENKALAASCTECVGAFVCVIYQNHWPAAFPCPASCNERNQSEGGLVFCAHDKTFRSIISGFPPRLFLKASISAFVADL